MNFEKKFNVGLTLDTNLRDFKAFIGEFHRYIYSIYFSPPLGYKFHTRSIIAMQLLLLGKKSQLWKMLDIVLEHGVKLEMVLNTLCLDGELVKKSADEINKRGINLESVCTLEGYYKYAREFFPGKKIIWSFNNGLRTERDINKAATNEGVNTFVLGSNFIRDNELFRRMSGSGKEVYLLLNNSCSFNCGTCNNTASTCSESFYRNLKEYSVEYLYALQSIFPCELHEGVIDCDHIRCFKISNRSSNLAFIRSALDSYINNSVREYVKKDCNNYAFWGRAGFFWKYFSKMDFDKIVRYKEQILNREFDIH